MWTRTLGILALLSILGCTQNSNPGPDTFRQDLADLQRLELLEARLGTHDIHLSNSPSLITQESLPAYSVTVYENLRADLEEYVQLTERLMPHLNTLLLIAENAPELYHRVKIEARLANAHRYLNLLDTAVLQIRFEDQSLATYRELLELSRGLDTLGLMITERTNEYNYEIAMGRLRALFLNDPARVPEIRRSLESLILHVDVLEERLPRLPLEVQLEIFRDPAEVQELSETDVRERLADFQLWKSRSEEYLNYLNALAPAS